MFGCREGNLLNDSLIKHQLGTIDWATGSLRSDSLLESTKTLGELKGIFRNDAAYAVMDAGQVVYRVQRILPVAEGTEGGLAWGTTTIEPGVVGDEYFMTHGHFHEKSNRGEMYATISGQGYLLFMDRNRNCWAEQMSPGSIHYVSSNLAHRTVNTGDDPLRFVACWPADAGHDYASIAQQGFGLRVVRQNGTPTIVK